MSLTSEVWTPRPRSSSRATSMSSTTSCSPFSEPGSISLMPVPIVIEQPEPAV
jgi:hypothetical protein